MTHDDFRRSFPRGASLGQQVHNGHGLRVFDRPPPREVRGSILWLGGRGDFIEKYLESFAHWHARGWQVTSFDWRGQGGSGRLLGNTGHIDDFATWLADLQAFWRAWQAPGPRVVIGHSMGGHLVLRALAERLIDPRAAVLVSPMLGFEAGPVPQWAAARAAALFGRIAPRRPAWKANERPAAGRSSRQAFLTSDIGRYDDEMWWCAKNPALALGPPSWGWMAASYRSFAVLDKRGVVEAMDTPVLVLGTDGDKLVSPAAIRRTADRLPHGGLKMWDEGVAHEILRERDAVRDDALARIDAFLDTEAPV